MVEKFHTELAELKTDVTAMGNLAIEMLAKSVKALQKQDTELAGWVQSKKTDVAKMDENAEEKALRLIALYQPMAKDLRTIAASLKIITYLARVGRYGKDIATIVTEISDKPPIAKLMSLPAMVDDVLWMLRDAMKAYESEDIGPIANIAERDDSVDALRYSIFRESITYMIEDSKNITRCAHYIMAARYLERCGDHACKISEKIHYMVTGESIDIK